MGKFSITGTVNRIDPVDQRANFTKQSVEIVERGEFQGNPKESFTLVDFFNNEINLLANIRVGQQVTVEGYMNGRRNEQPDGRVFYNYNYKGKSITPAFLQQGYMNPATGAQYQPYQPYQPQQQQGYQQQNGYNNGYRR